MFVLLSYVVCFAISDLMPWHIHCKLLCKRHIQRPSLEQCLEKAECMDWRITSMPSCSTCRASGRICGRAESHRPAIIARISDSVSPSWARRDVTLYQIPLLLGSSTVQLARLIHDTARFLWLFLSPSGRAQATLLQQCRFGREMYL